MIFVSPLEPTAPVRDGPRYAAEKPRKVKRGDGGEFDRLFLKALEKVKDE